jgi:P-type Cu+ transporter
VEPTENTGNSLPVFVQTGDSSTPSAELFTDPVCQMKVGKEDAIDHLAYKGHTYYFCHVNCIVRFNRNPDQYAVAHEPHADGVALLDEESESMAEEPVLEVEELTPESVPQVTKSEESAAKSEGQQPKSGEPEPEPEKLEPEPEESSPEPETLELKPEESSPEPEAPEPKPEESSPEPETPEPKPEQSSPEPETPEPKPEESSPEPETPEPKPEQSSPEPETPEPKPEQSSPEPETPEPKPEESSPEPETPEPKPEESSPEPDKLEQKPERPSPEPEKLEQAARPQYTCPMHPQILADLPGPCPLCGMALELLEPTLALEDDTELRDMERRFQLAIPLTMSVFLCGLPDMLGLPAEQLISGFTPPMVNFAQLVLTSPVIWLAAPFFGRAMDSFKNRSWNMFTLIGSGVAITYLYSLVASLAPASIPSGFDMHDGVPFTYFEPAAVITTLALLGQVLELKARKQTGLAIRELLHLTPEVAHFVKLDGNEIDINIGDLAIKDKLRVRPGENIPTDGIVLDGRSAVDESMVTGESNLVDKSSGDTVIGGTTNQAGCLTMVATQVGKDTLVARIVKLVAGAQRSRAPVQQQVDKITRFFVPAVAIVALVTFIAWAAWGPPPVLKYALLNAIAVLIIACPCALGLATPMSVMVAMGRGAKAGVLIRDAQALEKLSSVKLLVVDKTGTLTEGRPTVSKVICLGKWAEGQIMMLAAAVEAGSEHPLARAFVEHADSRDLADCKATDFFYQPGGGVTANADGHSLVIGSARFLREVLTTGKADLEKALSRVADQVEAMTRDGITPVMVACDGDLAAVVALSDKVRPSAKATVDELKLLGIKVHMLTGDKEATARYVAEQLGITDVTAEVSPMQKHDFIVQLQKTAEPGTVAMAGDGINDAPALAQAAVGIAMGSGTNIAIESADIVLAHGDLSGILRAVRLSQAMKANIKQNLILAFGYNVLAVPVAAGVLYPFTGLLLNPVVASLAMSFSSVSVIANALRLRRTAL